MKFAKLLDRTRELSPEAWRHAFLNYKALKKLINDINIEMDISETALPEEVAKSLAQDPGEVKFFTKLRQELAKISRFYLEQEAAYAALYQDVMGAFDRVESRGEAVTDETASALARRLLEFYMDLLRLENFAVMNYCGFGKILKKHDKRTGFSTKLKFMRHLVDGQDFAQYPRLMRMLAHTERSYRRLLSLVSPATRASLAEGENKTALRELHGFKESRPGALETQSDSEEEDGEERAPAPRRSKSELDIAAVMLGVREAKDVLTPPSATGASFEEKKRDEDTYPDITIPGIAPIKKK